MKENKVYGMNQFEAWRQRPEEIRQEVAATRLEKAARETHETTPHVVRDPGWELARYLERPTRPTTP